MNIIIDSSVLKPNRPEDITVYFKDKIPSHLKRVTLKSVIIFSEIPIQQLFQNIQNIRYAYICCDILDKDVNLLNSGKSEILRIMTIEQPSAKSLRCLFVQNFCKKLKYNDIRSIRLYLTNCNQELLKVDKPFSIIYELEFT